MTRRQGLMTWVLGSAALMLLGAFGPWVKALGVGVSGTDGSNDGWLVVIAAVVGGGLFYVRRDRSMGGRWAVLGGLGGAVVTIYDRQHLQHKIEKGGALVQALAHVGWGLNLAMVASISLAVAGFIWAREAGKGAAQAGQEPSSPTPSPPRPHVTEGVQAEHPESHQSPGRSVLSEWTTRKPEEAPEAPPAPQA